MSETTLEARIAHGAPAKKYSPTGKPSPKKTWKKQKPYSANHHSQAWSPPHKPSFEHDPYSTHVSPSLLDRLGPKVAQATKRQSLLERLELDGVADIEPVAQSESSDHDFIPFEAVRSSEMDVSEDGPISVAHNVRDDEREDSQMSSLMKNTQTEKIHSRSAFPTPLFELSSNPYLRLMRLPSLIASCQILTTPSVMAVPDFPHEGQTSMPLADSTSSQKTASATVPLLERIGDALRSAVSQNATRRGPKGTMNMERLQSRIGELVTESVAQSFLSQMDTARAQWDALAANKLPDGLDPKNGVGDNNSNTWLFNRRASNSHITSVASTSVLPTPPASFTPPISLAADMIKPAPKAPRAMLGRFHDTPPLPPKLRATSLKGKERASESPYSRDGPNGRSRGSSIHSTRTGAETGQDANSDSVPSRADSWGSERRAFHNKQPSPSRPTSLSLSRSPVARSRRPPHPDELPTYRSPSRERPSRRKASHRSRSRTPARITGDSLSNRRTHRNRSRSHPPASPTRGRASSKRNSFNTRRPFSPITIAFSSTNLILWQVHPDPLPLPLPRPELPSYIHQTHIRSLPLSIRPAWAPQFNSAPQPIAQPTPAQAQVNAPVSSPQIVLPAGPTPTQVQSRASGPHPQILPPVGATSSAGKKRIRRVQNLETLTLTEDTAARPPPPNPCNNVPGLWFAKLGAERCRILECRFVVEPAFAIDWNLLPRLSGTSAPLKPKLSVRLLCLPRGQVEDRFSKLGPHVSPATVAETMAEIETAWPQNGTLYVDINKHDGAGEDMAAQRNCGASFAAFDPTLPLDLTGFIRPGPNVIRLIQLVGMQEHAFILHASPALERDPFAEMFNKAIPMDTDNSLFNFHATVAVSNS
ncbi:hypothetical protein C8J57DRAFT_1497993 [Mycena rebaudengoi]|nr:hypothetical protein C8J57DRAFT_1497993 [Mycena rebaudengoi]